MKVFCLDVGGTMIKYALLDENREIEDQGEIPTVKTTKEDFVQSLAGVINPYLALYEIVGIGISFPGYINPATGFAERAGAIEVLDGENILTTLRQELINPDVPMVIENDAKCAAIAEHAYGNGMEVDDFCLLTLGTGVGGAFVSKGEVVHGHSFKSGELGMMVIDYGRNGFKNLHELASTSALIRFYKESKELDEEAAISGQEIFADESKQAKDVLENWSMNVALAIFNVVCQHDPKKVLIGGGISRNPKLLGILADSLGKIPYWEVFKVPLEICQFQNFSGILGAYHLICKKLEETV